MERRSVTVFSLGLICTLALATQAFAMQDAKPKYDCRLTNGTPGFTDPMGNCRAAAGVSAPTEGGAVISGGQAIGSEGKKPKGSKGGKKDKP